LDKDTAANAPACRTTQTLQVSFPVKQTQIETINIDKVINKEIRFKAIHTKLYLFASIYNLIIILLFDKYMN